MQALHSFSTPQLERIHRGKVRDSFRIDDASRLLVASDRLSAFDSVLQTPIPGKGAILNRLSAHWFEETADIVPNHMLRTVADRAMVVREVEPIRVEMIVRAFITGSAWRAYAAGQRTLSGVTFPEGLSRNQRLPEPIVTPTTKSEHDAEITPDEIVRQGLAEEAVYRRMEEAALGLFAHASARLLELGLHLVDTKYEFGLLDGEVILIDEIHTPDSSRFWAVDDYDRSPDLVSSWDKEYVRRWLLEEKEAGRSLSGLPEHVVDETAKRYADLYERVTGSPPPPLPVDGAADLVSDLVDARLMKDASITIVMGSAADSEHARSIAKHLDDYDVAVVLRVASAHKTPGHVERLADELNASAEPGAVIAVAGLSNGLGGALAANLNLPVINCPPFADREDMLLNLHSSLMMPSSTPAMTVIKPQNAAQAALRALNLPRLRTLALDEIDDRRRSLIESDDVLRMSDAAKGSGS